MPIIDTRDNFNGVALADMNGRVPDTISSGAWSHNNGSGSIGPLGDGRIGNYSPAGGNLDHYIVGAPRSPNYSVIAEGCFADGEGTFLGLVARYTASNQHYRLISSIGINAAGNPCEWQFGKSASGFTVFNQGALGSAGFLLTAFKLRLTVAGSKISAYFNDILLHSVTDTTHTGIGKPGIVGLPASAGTARTPRWDISAFSVEDFINPIRSVV